MKLNLKKLSELELEYEKSPIARNTLQTLVDTVMYDDKDTTSVAKVISMTTLEELGVLDRQGKKEVQQLNS